MAVSAGSQEKGAIGAMFEREMKQEKNLEVSSASKRKCPMFSYWNDVQCPRVSRSGLSLVSRY